MLECSVVLPHPQGGGQPSSPAAVGLGASSFMESAGRLCTTQSVDRTIGKPSYQEAVQLI
jgi:hypothetical protein